MKYLLISAVVLAGLSTTPSFAEPKRLWSLPLGDLSRSVVDTALAVDQNRAIVAINDFSQNQLWLIDLETGEIAERLFPTPDYRYITAVAADEDHFIVLSENGEGASKRRFQIAIYDFETLELGHTLLIPDEVLELGYNHRYEFNGFMLDGNNILLSVTQDDLTQNWKTLLQFDLASGSFVRGIGRNHILPKAENETEKGSTARLSYTSSFVANGTLYTNVSAYQDTSSPRVIGLDLDKGELTPPIAPFDGSPKYATLKSVDNSSAYYALTPEFSTSNIIQIGSAQRVDLKTNEVTATYPDPFAPEDTELTFDDFVYRNITTGLRPYTGSWYPEEISISEGYFIATAPNAPAGGPESSGAIVIYALDGQPYSILGSAQPQPDLYFGREFVHSGQFILTTDRTIGSESSQDRSLVLFRLD